MSAPDPMRHPDSAFPETVFPETVFPESAFPGAAGETPLVEIPAAPVRHRGTGERGAAAEAEREPDPDALAMNEPLLHCRGISFSWPGNSVLRDVDLSIRRGEVLIVGGPSGQGKSTLLRLLIGLERPDAGQIFLLGDNIWNVSRPRLRDLRRRTGYVFQNGALVSNMTVRDNIALPLRYHTKLPESRIRDIVGRWISNLLLTGHEDKLPAMLSLGMRKRAAVARAMVLQPEILFLDEPTAGLDSMNRGVMLALIDNLRASHEVSIVMVTHDLQAGRQLGGRIALLLNQSLTPPRPLEELLHSRDPAIRTLVSDEISTKH